MVFDYDFYTGKKVLVTGHTGFKGAWMCMVLGMLGANVVGYALEPQSEQSLYNLCNHDRVKSYIGDIRDLKYLNQVFTEEQPEIVIHMAAQPLVRESYRNPVYTYETNVMGTVHIMECVRNTVSVKSVINVTTDKVYKNKEWNWGYRENEELNGYDPYSNSKSCSELVTSSYIKSFFMDREIAISTCRAGNVIGGGDFAKDRIIPDCIRAAESGQNIMVRNPFSTRPYQHVLEPVVAYLIIAAAQYKNLSLAGSYNIGPDDAGCWTTGRLVDQFCATWKEKTGELIVWENRYDGGPHEANFLKLDCSLIKSIFGWKPVWNIPQTMDKIVEWEMSYRDKENGNVLRCMETQIKQYLEQLG